jgi:Carbohydrate binding module (family 6)
MNSNYLRLAAAALFTTALAGLLSAQVPADYKGKPWKGKMLTLPGKLTFAFYDEGGEGIAYHDADKVNHGSGKLNRGPEEKNNFRKDEGVDISFTKPAFDKFTDGKLLPVDQYYVGWTAQGEWLNYTVDVQSPGTFTLNILATGVKNNNEATLSLSVNGKQKCTFKIEDTGDYHRWKMQTNVGEITLDKGPQLLTLKFEKQAHASNLLYLEFIPKEPAVKKD